jgi:predicted DNA-binding transcriptional regulator AlpA
VKRHRTATTPREGASAALARTIGDIWRLLRTFGGNRLAGSPDQSECPEPQEDATFSAPETWLHQHLEEMTDQFADMLAARLKTPPPTEGLASMLLTKRQVSLELQCSGRTVDRWCEEGLLPEPLHIGGSVRWMRKDLEAWFRDREWQR